jgi:hypothetical protein
VQLCGYGSQAPRIINGFIYANLTNSVSVVADSEGLYHFTLYSNDQIVPDGTYYTFTFLNANGDVQQVNAYRFVGTGEWDTSVLVPYDPNQPPPPLPPLITNLLEIVTAADNMVFDGTTYTAFKTTLSASVTQPVFQNMIPGNLYTFIILQNGTGGWDFDWAANVKNPVNVDHAANSTTVQTFVADDLDNLLAISAGTYYP